MINKFNIGAFTQFNYDVELSMTLLGPFNLGSTQLNYKYQLRTDHKKSKDRDANEKLTAMRNDKQIDSLGSFIQPSCFLFF